MDEMHVIKRDGNIQPMLFDKILHRLKTLGLMEPVLHINYTQLVINIMDKMHEKITTSKIDELTASECAYKSSIHPDFGSLAGRIIVSNNHKNTTPSLSTLISVLHKYNLINEEYYNLVNTHYRTYENMLDYGRDYDIDFFGFKTLERAYLMQYNGTILERPQHMWLRVAIAIHKDNMVKVKETYDLMSMKYFTHATPTLFNAGTKCQQLSSCFLVAMQEDSIDGIYDTLKQCAQISKRAGGIGLHIHNIRAKNSHISGTNGVSNGIVPMLRTFNETARYVDQGGGKRKGSFAIYLSPDHGDIEDWVDLKKNTGDENMRARDLFYGLWIPDLFMQKIKENKEWCLFCPHQCPGLNDVYGDEYKQLYEKYESEKKYTKKIIARDLWYKILAAQMETGNPSLLFKDACNKKSNQKNIGTIKSSNLCTEIIQYSDKNETAVCNLASISLSKFVVDKKFDYDLLHFVTKVVTRNLNNLIDVNEYPTEKALANNIHRPIGIGVQGLADAFALMDIPFHSDEALEVNKFIFETMYHGALEQSMELAKEHGYYDTFYGSPLSMGQFQFDLWNVTPTNRYDWNTMRGQIMKTGVRNSLLIALMPTASTSQILGNNECFEPFTSNLYARRTLAGDFTIVNQHLVKELIQLNLWNEQLKDDIIQHKGSIQALKLPDHIKRKYKIVWEIPMKHLINMSRDRSPYICQSQSLNLWIESPTIPILTSMHFYAWEQGLKTGIYYLRRKPKHQVQQFTIAPTETCETCSA
jgi:ribonucleoside-diphosphate reductase alpha subunit